VLVDRRRSIGGAATSRSEEWDVDERVGVPVLLGLAVEAVEDGILYRPVDPAPDLNTLG
jgi:hypothetical protein